MKYFLDTEFLEGTQNKNFLGFIYGKTKSTIDLISIGIVSEDGREYYAISKDFNLKEAWNRFDLIDNTDNVGYRIGCESRIKKVYWIKENVLKPIFEDLIKREYSISNVKRLDFNFKHFKKLINKYGKTNKQIAEEIYNFCTNDYHKGNSLSFEQRKTYDLYDNFKPEFYAYYADYDWIVFCWLFGKMINLPKGFPMYCIDLKQELERLNETLGYNNDEKNKSYKIQEHKDYPKQTNEHNALSDALFCKELYYFLNSL